MSSFSKHTRIECAQGMSLYIHNTGINSSITAEAYVSGTPLSGIRRYPDVLKKLKYLKIRALQIRNRIAP